jgi:hypothetical protein
VPRARLTVSIALASAALVVAVGAQARTPAATGWTKLPSGPAISSYEAALARTSDGTLHVAYLRSGGATQDIWHVAIDRVGAVTSVNPVVTGWPLLNNPDIVSTSTGLQIFFGGIRSNSPTEPNKSLNTATAPTSGSPWNLQTGDPAAPSTAYQSPVAAAVTKDGTLVEAWASTFGLDYHFGTNPAIANIRVPGHCCYYDPRIAVDSSSGQTVLGWYSNEDAATAGSSAGPGMFMQEISPSGLVGARRPAPGSASADDRSSVSPLYRTPVTGRIGAPGVYLVYGAGYPTFLAIDVLRFGSAAPALQIPASGALGANVAAAPDGRLWVFWKRDNVLFATRTNKAVTRLEPISTIAPPAGTDTVWRLDGDAALGPLDLVANIQTNEAGFWYRRLLPRLSLHASALGHGDARFVVTDAGDPIAGAKVKLRGHVVSTDASGIARLHLRLGPGTATAARAGYTGASAYLVVR